MEKSHVEIEIDLFFEFNLFILLMHLILLIRRDLSFYIKTNEFNLKIIIVDRFLFDFYIFE